MFSTGMHAFHIDALQVDGDDMFDCFCRWSD